MALTNKVSVRHRKSLGIGVPSYRRIGVTNPSHKDRESEFPPTEEIHVDVGVSSLYPFLFLLLKQQKPGRLCFQRVSVWVHVV